MVLKLYGTSGLGFARPVAAVLYEKKIPFELVEVNMKEREHKTPEFLAKQPFGQIPYIVSDCPSKMHGGGAESSRKIH